MLAKAQDKFTGIGIFKIGTDTSIVYKYAKENKIKIREITKGVDLSYMRLIDNPYTIASLKPKEKLIIGHINKSGDKYSLDINACPDVTQYILSSYEVDSIKMKMVELTFYKNKLQKFKCKYDKIIVEAVESKYGTTNREIKSDTSKCLYNTTGIERLLISKRYYNTLINGDIKMTAYIGTFFDDHCKESYGSDFNYEQRIQELYDCSLSSMGIQLNQKPKLKDLKNF
jgi:hypothetical protein